MGTSFTECRGSGFWTRDAALEAVLALLVVELDPVASDDEALESVLDAWTVQAVAGFIGCVSPGLDEHLTARPSQAAAVTAALKRIRNRLPPGGTFVVGSAALARRADRDRSADRIIRWTTAVAVIGVAAIAAGSAETARDKPVTGWTARLIPLTVDGLIYAVIGHHHQAQTRRSKDMSVGFLVQPVRTAKSRATPT